MHITQYRNFILRARKLAARCSVPDRWCNLFRTFYLECDVQLSMDSFDTLFDLMTSEALQGAVDVPTSGLSSASLLDTTGSAGGRDYGYGMAGLAGVKPVRSPEALRLVVDLLCHCERAPELQARVMEALVDALDGSSAGIQVCDDSYSHELHGAGWRRSWYNVFSSSLVCPSAHLSASPPVRSSVRLPVCLSVCRSRASIQAKVWVCIATRACVSHRTLTLICRNPVSCL